MANDWCTEDGAKRLKHKIEQYWSERGYEVNVDLVDACFIAAMRSARTDVRSNMVNGMPRRRVVTDERGARRSYTSEASRDAVAA
ncbi:MAG: hypothetical protein AAFY34_01750 [Pseudomonadota bacterium]